MNDRKFISKLRRLIKKFEKSRFKTIDEQIRKFEYLGSEVCENGAVLIGRTPNIAKFAWSHSIYKPLTDEEISKLSNDLKTDIPESYKRFLQEYSNGLSFFVSTFYLDGLRKDGGRSIEASRQPYSLILSNLKERPKNAKESYFFIGGYNWDGSHLYIDKADGKVHFCARWDATSLYSWNSFEEMLESEILRIIPLFDENGVKLDKDLFTTPIEMSN